MPPQDTNLLNDETEQTLPLDEVERLEHTLGEPRHLPGQTVVARELRATRGEGCALAVELPMPIVDVLGAPLHVDEIDEASLIEVG